MAIAQVHPRSSSHLRATAVRLLELAGGAIASGAVLVLALRAALHFDDSWDSTSYHLPFAAFRAGILTLDDFRPLPHLVEAARSFPPLLDVLRGYTWRITGSIRVLQLFNLAAILALAAFWKRRFALPLRWTVIAVLSVPLLQIGATTLYADPFANCFFAIPLTALTCAYLDRRPLGRDELAIALVALGVAANSKPQFIALGALLFAVLWSHQLFRLGRESRRGELRRALAVAAIASLPVLFTAWRNLAEFGNPLYPFTFTVGGHSLPGMLTTAIWPGPDDLRSAPQPLRWLASVLEIHAWSGHAISYTVDQAPPIPIGSLPTAEQARSPAFRMGGYFAPLVLGLLVWLWSATRAFAARDRLRWWVPFLLTSALVAPLPGSHELRYFSFWILELVFLGFLAAEKARATTVSARVFLIAAFLALGTWTGWRPFGARPYGVQDHIRAHGIDTAVTGADLCFEHRNRDPVLFTHVFHAKGRYRVVDLPPGERCPPASPP